MGFSTLDGILVLIYLVGIAVAGAWVGGKQSSAQDYFLGGKRIPWWAVCFAIVATETSTLTFISIPGLAYVSNLNFLQIAFGYILGRIVVARVLLPAYYRGELTTAYAFLSRRFGAPARTTASAVFMGTRLLADGVRLFATAIPLKLLVGIDYPTAIAVTALVTLLYTYIGGVRSVIWMDVVQMFIYIGGAVAAIVVLTVQLPEGLASLDRVGNLGEKLSVFRWGVDKGAASFFATPYTLVASVIGGAFLSMASHGTDQLIVQRILTAPSLKDGQRAIIVSGFIVTAQFALFLFIGILLFAFYGGAAKDANEVFIQYIISNMPTGVSGLIIAGLLAAAMSTLAGSINALASATVFDFIKPNMKEEMNPVREVRISRFVSFVWCALIVASALFFMNTTKAVVELALSIASFTYGGLLGSFLLGVLFVRPRQRDMLVGFAAGVGVMIAVVYLTNIAWTWYTVIGAAVTIAVGTALSGFGQREKSES